MLCKVVKSDKNLTNVKNCAIGLDKDYNVCFTDNRVTNGGK